MALVRGLIAASSGPWHPKLGLAAARTFMVAIVILMVSVWPSSILQAAVTAGSHPATSRPAGNLVANGTFEKRDASGKLPAGWSTRHPDNVRLVSLGPPHNQVIEMTGDRQLMGTYGVDLTGPKIPFKPNTRYRCTGYTKSAGPKMIVFVKGYATVTRRNKGQPETIEDVVYQMRKEIEPSADWQPFNLDVEIKPVQQFSDFQHRIEYLRITLWGYWPEGTCWFDDIRFEEAGPIGADQRLHGDPVTHVGTKARLAESPATAPATFDEEQIWIDASNAFQEERYEEAATLAAQLMDHSPRRVDYHLLAARAAAGLQQWDQADKHALWLLNPPGWASVGSQPAAGVEPWHLDWAKVVHGQVLLHTDCSQEGRRILMAVVKDASSPHAKAAAEQILNDK